MPTEEYPTMRRALEVSAQRMTIQYVVYEVQATSLDDARRQFRQACEDGEVFCCDSPVKRPSITRIMELPEYDKS
jgi:hypothetical protein